MAAVTGVPSVGQQARETPSDPCAHITIPTLTDEQAEKNRKRRKKLDCDKIYTDRVKSFNVNVGRADARLLELGSKAELRYLTEIVQVIALKEKTLCIYFKGNPEISEEFRRCRERQIDAWEKEIIDSIAKSREVERASSRLTGPAKSQPGARTAKERAADALGESLRLVRERGRELVHRMDDYEFKRWSPPPETKNAPSP